MVLSEYLSRSSVFGELACHFARVLMRTPLSTLILLHLKTRPRIFLGRPVAEMTSKFGAERWRSLAEGPGVDERAITKTRHLDNCCFSSDVRLRRLISFTPTPLRCLGHDTQATAGPRVPSGAG